MKFAGHIVRKGLIAKLKNQIFYNNSFVPVYGRVPDNATYPYIKVNDTAVNEVDFNQSSFMQTVSSTIEVVTRFSSDAGGFGQADQIANLVLQVVRTRSSGYMDLTDDGFNVYTQTLGFTAHVHEADKDYYYYRTIISLDVRVQELADSPAIFWVIQNGFWNDGGTWIDTETWID